MERKKVCDKLKKKKVMQTEEKHLSPPHVLLGVRVKGTDFKLEINHVFFDCIFTLRIQHERAENIKGKRFCKNPSLSRY